MTMLDFTERSRFHFVKKTSPSAFTLMPGKPKRLNGSKTCTPKNRTGSLKCMEMLLEQLHEGN